MDIIVQSKNYIVLVHRSLRSPRATILMVLCFVLFFAYVLFLAGIEQTSFVVRCSFLSKLNKYTKCSSTSYSSCEILTCIFLFLQPGRHSRHFFSSVFVCASVRLGHNFIEYRHILHLS